MKYYISSQRILRNVSLEVNVCILNECAVMSLLIFLKAFTSMNRREGIRFALFT